MLQTISSPPFQVPSSMLSPMEMKPIFPITYLSLPFLLVLLLSQLPASSSVCNFPAIFNFGDSNSDTGGLSATFWPLPLPYGETFFGTSTGRFSDGRLLIDFVAESLGLPHLSAYLDSVGANFSHGANFATAASTIMPQKLTLPTKGGYSPVSLDVQLMQFLEFRPRSRSVYKRGGVFKGLMPREDYFKRALYTIDIGQNDLNAGFVANKSADEFIPDAMNRFSVTVKSIYEIGGRYFWIHNTGPLGCLTYALLSMPHKEAELDSIGCGVPYNNLAKEFNRKLNETVAHLRSVLPDAALTYVDVYTVKYALFRQAREHGFEHPFNVCCGHGGGKYNLDFNVRCGETVKVNGTRVVLAKSCKDPAKRINWDGAHYTEAANKWVFEQIQKGAFSDPHVPLSMACQRDAT